MFIIKNVDIMHKVTPGNTDLSISPIVLGGNVFGWTLSEKESFGILDAAQSIQPIYIRIGLPVMSEANQKPLSENG